MFFRTIFLLKDQANKLLVRFSCLRLTLTSGEMYAVYLLNFPGKIIGGKAILFN